MVNFVSQFPEDISTTKPVVFTSLDILYLHFIVGIKDMK